MYRVTRASLGRAASQPDCPFFGVQTIDKVDRHSNEAALLDANGDSADGMTLGYCKVQWNLGYDGHLESREISKTATPE